MKLKYIVPFVLLLFPVIVSSQNEQIEFNEDGLALLKLQARNTGKLIFIYAYAKDTGPCEQMENEVFTSTEVVNWINKYFIAARFDVMSPEGKEITSEYELTSVPAFVFLDKNGEQVDKAEGVKTVNEFLKFIQEGLKKSR